MTREEAKTFLLQLHTDKQLNKSEHEALRIAIKALEQEPCREADDYENEISNLYNHLDIVEYDKERLREEVTTLEEKLKGLSTEPCEGAISRQAVIDVIEKWLKCSGYNEAERHIMRAAQSVLYDSPSVTPQPKIGHCKDCKWWKDSDGAYRRGIDAESKCPMNRIEVYEGNGYCFMFEPQESEE